MSNESTGARKYELTKVLQIWDAFKNMELDMKPPPDWIHQEIPPELQNIENDSESPEKLKLILTWSLALSSGFKITDEEQSIPLQQAEIWEPEAQVIEASGQSLANTQSASLPVIDETHGSQHASESASFISKQSSEKGRFHQRSISNGIFASTRDLITNLRSKLEKGPSPSVASEETPQREPSTVECTSCFEDTSTNEAKKLPCSHAYCKPCLTTLITTALQTEASFPPKCCLTEIPLRTILSVLNEKQRLIYKEKAAEYSIPAQERWYCPNSKCLKWIRPSKFFRIPAFNERCPHCATKICTICRGTAHKSSENCPQDFGTEDMITLAELEGWRRCLRCRALVERTQGCRHMTCRCGAQFCYTCGAKWRTCSCTETDEANRQALLRRRRAERDRARDAESAEIARIIAQVEEAERREARERAEEEERQAAERRREEAELARLEEQRLREEEARRQEEARLEELYRRMLRVSVEESCDALQNAWNDLRQVQAQSLDARHTDAERRLNEARDSAIAQQEQEDKDMSLKMEMNVEKRTAKMNEKHDSELNAFTSEQRDLEDDMFLEIQLHLRGKQDKEARERRLFERFQKQRDESHRDLLAKHKSEREFLEASTTMEMQGLRLAHKARMAGIESRLRSDFHNLVEEVAKDRAWFELLSKRRQNMISANRRLMLEAVEAGLEPTGLTQDVAATIGPLLEDMQTTTDITPPQSQELLEVDTNAHQMGGRQWREKLSPSPASSASPTRSFVELAATSRHLLDALEASPAAIAAASQKTPPAQAAANDQLLLNSAFAWMAGVVPRDTAHQGISNSNPGNQSPRLTRSQAVSRHGYTRSQASRHASMGRTRAVDATMSGTVQSPRAKESRNESQYSPEEQYMPGSYPSAPHVQSAPKCEIPAIYLHPQPATGQIGTDWPLSTAPTCEIVHPRPEMGKTEIEWPLSTQPRPANMFVTVNPTMSTNANDEERNGATTASSNSSFHASHHSRHSSMTNLSATATTPASSVMTLPLSNSSSPSVSRSSLRPPLSPLSPPRCAGAVKKGDGSMFLHSLRTKMAATTTATSASVAVAAAVVGLSPVSPISPAGEMGEMNGANRGRE